MLRVAQRHPSALLLAAQLAGLLLCALAEGRHAERVVFSGVALVVVGLVVWTVLWSPGRMWIAVLLGAPAMVLRLVQAVTGNDDLVPYSSALEAVLLFYAAGVLVASILRSKAVTRDELFGVGAAFTLVTAAFASAYVVVQAIEPGSFGAGAGTSGERSWVELLMLSVSTLSSVGIGDVVPVKPTARSVVMVEQLAGVAFLAMLVSRLIGLLILRAQDRDRSSTSS